MEQEEQSGSWNECLGLERYEFRIWYLLKIRVPPYCDILKITSVLALENIINSHKNPSQITVAIAVSDNTRPVPYNGEKEDGILLPLLERLEKIGVGVQNIKIILGTGTHSATSDDWKRETFGKYIKSTYEMMDHDYSSSGLFYLGDIDEIPVKINRQFFKADIHLNYWSCRTSFYGWGLGRKEGPHAVPLIS